MKELNRILLCGLLAGTFASGCVIKASDGGDDDEEERSSDADSPDDRSEADSGDDAGSMGSDGAAGSDDGEGGDGAGSMEGSESGDGSSSVTVFACESRSESGAVVVSDDVTENVTWSGNVFIDGQIDVYDDAVVTIEPGTNLIFAADADIDFGWNSQAVTVKAEGTADKPIRFCGQRDDAGLWRGVTIGRNVTTDSVFAHVLISDAGGSGTALSVFSPVLFTNVQVVNSGGEGVRATAFKSGSSDLSVVGTMSYPVVCDEPQAVDSFPLGGIIEDNGDAFVLLDYSDVTSDVTFHKLPVPYLQKDSVDVYQEAVMVFEAGVDYRFGADTRLTIGWNSQVAELQVEGTEEAPVTFQGQVDQSGFWASFMVNRNVVSSSTIRHAVFSHGGALDNDTLVLDAPITIDHVTLQDNEHGVRISQEGVKSGSSNLTVTGTKDVPLSTEPNGMLVLPLSESFIGNDKDYVSVNGGDLTKSGTIPQLDVPFAIEGSIDQYMESDVSIEAGTIIRMKVDTRWLVGWNGQVAALKAQGTAEAPIRFVGFEEEKGFWSGLEFGRNVASDSVLDHVEIGYAGEGGAAALRLYKPLDVANTHVFMSAGPGVAHDDSDTNDYAGNGNSFADNDGEDVTTL